MLGYNKWTSNENVAVPHLYSTFIYLYYVRSVCRGGGAALYYYLRTVSRRQSSFRTFPIRFLFCEIRLKYRYMGYIAFIGRLDRSVL